MGDFQRLLHLRAGEGEHVGVAARGRAVNEARIGKQVGRAPEQFDAGALLFGFQDLDDGVEIFVRLAQCPAFRRDIAVVKGVERRAEFLDELERDPRAVFGIGHRVRAVVPRADGGANAERVGAGAAERVPIDDREAQMIAHGFAGDDFGGVVMFEGQRIFGFRAFEFYFRDIFKNSFHGDRC